MSLTRRKPLRAKPRAKGNRGELAVRDLMREYGWPQTRRNWQSGGQGGGDLIEGPADVGNEVKWCEKAEIWAWLSQCANDSRPTDIPVVWCRCNATPWFAVLPQHEYVALRALDPKPNATVVVEPGRRLSLWKQIDEAIGLAEGLMVPQLVFSRAGSEVYSAVPAGELLRLLRIREFGI